MSIQNSYKSDMTKHTTEKKRPNKLFQLMRFSTKQLKPQTWHIKHNRRSPNKCTLTVITIVHIHLAACHSHCEYSAFRFLLLNPSLSRRIAFLFQHLHCRALTISSQCALQSQFFLRFLVVRHNCYERKKALSTTHFFTDLHLK